ncbi:MAG: translocation/assembly module TamB domain-containing protein [Labilithrix sp.]|nr:translocation/assembly module TamB domain-containing protein [Labilithrix sp.]
MRVLGLICSIVGATAIFAGAVAGGVVAHLDVPATRRLVATQATAILRAQLAGEVAIEHVGSLGLGGAGGVRVRVRDPSGAQVLFADGVSVRVRGLAAARSALFGKGDVAIDVPAVAVDHVDVAIDADDRGESRIARAFAPKHAQIAPERPDQAQKKPAQPGRGVRVEAPSIALRHAWIHGAAGGAPAIDAEVTNLVASAHYDPKRTHAQLERVDVATRGLPRGADLRGRVRGDFTMPSVSGEEMGVDASFEGTIAGAPANARAHLDGRRLDAVVVAHDASGDHVRAAFGEVAVHDDVTLYAEAHGELPRVDGRARLAVGAGTVDVDARVDARNETRLDASATVRRIDLKRITPSAPASSLGLDARASLVVSKKGELDGEIVLDTSPSRVVVDGDWQTVPPVRARADFTRSSAHVVARVADPRATLDLAIDYDAPRKIVDAKLDADVPDLALLPVPGVKGAASLSAKGSVDLATKRLDARAAIRGSGLAYARGAIDDVRINAWASGSIDAPIVDVGTHAGGLRAGDRRLGSADVRTRIARGPRGALVFRDAHVDLASDRDAVSASAASLEIADTRIALEGGVVHGLGAPIRANFRREGSRVVAKVDAPSIDVARAVRLAGGSPDVRAGRFAIQGDVTLDRRGAAGAIYARLDAFSAYTLESASAGLDVTFDGREIDIDAKGDLGVGRFAFSTTDVALGGSPIEPSSWIHASGGARFDASFDLAKVAKLAPQGSLPLGEIGGELVTRGTIARDSADAPPDLRLHARTRGLVVAGHTALEPPIAGTRVSGVAPWRSQGIDGQLDVRVDATSGWGEVAFRAFDRKGAVAIFDAKAELPYREILERPREALSRLESAPLRAKALVPERALSELPDILGTRGFSGTAFAELDVSGTALAPRVDLVARARKAKAPSVPAAMVSDVDVGLVYDGAGAEIGVKVRERDHDVLELASRVEVRARDVLDRLEQPLARPLPWRANGKVKLDGFALETINELADRYVRGRVSGEAVVEDLNHDAKARAEIDLTGMRLGNADYARGKIVVDAREGRGTVAARLDQTDGFADLRAGLGLTWGAALAPSLDESVPLDVELEAKAFRVAAAQPFLDSAVNALDGRIDAKAKVRIVGGQEPRMEGQLALRDGVVQLSALGSELRKIRGTALFSPDGTIKIDDVHARGVSGELAANATIKLRGLALDTAEAHLLIPRRRSFDLAMQGQPIGQVWGAVKLDAKGSPDGKRIAVTVDVPRAGIELPQMMKSGVQELGEIEDVRVGTYRDPKTFVMLPLGRDGLRHHQEEARPQAPGTEVEIDVKLGDIVIVRGNQVRVVLGGDTKIETDGATRISGRLEARQGRINVQGKQFEIDRAVITLQPEDPSNPIVVATAQWTADDGTRVYADFVGPVKTGRVTLRSEPPRPKNEILAIMLFGSADGVNAAPPPPGRAPSGATRAAVGIGGGFAAEGLSQAIDDLTGIEATVRVDTSRANNPAPELRIQISPRVSVEFQHVLGTPPISEPDKNLVTFDWRFKRNWSLETTFGDRGKAQADAVWQKRY